MSAVLMVCKDQYICLYVLSSVLWCQLRFPHRNDVRVICTHYTCSFTYCGLQHISCCDLFSLRLVLSISLDCQFLIAISVFSNLYLWDELFYYISLWADLSQNTWTRPSLFSGCSSCDIFKYFCYV